MKRAAKGRIRRAEPRAIEGKEAQRPCSENPQGGHHAGKRKPADRQAGRQSPPTAPAAGLTGNPGDHRALATGDWAVSCVRIERRSEKAVQRHRSVAGGSEPDVGSSGQRSTQGSARCAPGSRGLGRSGVLAGVAGWGVKPHSYSAAVASSSSAIARSPQRPRGGRALR